MRKLFVVLKTLVVLLVTLNYAYTFQFGTWTRIRRSNLLLRGTQASLTDVKIDSAVYEEDLYGVLGVTRNSSKAVLKEAYMKIVFKSHPDRNNTAEALSLFRNATYAYQILGKDEKSRAAYDRKLDAQSYMDALEGVGNDFIKPLAMDIAVPLLNLTFRSVKSIAFPFLRDVFEQSSAVVMATMNADNADTFDSIVARASTARY